MKTLFHDRHQHIDRHRDPDLSDDRVLGGAEEGLDPKVLFDPAEEQFDLPAAAIELSQGQSGKQKIVGQEGQTFGGFRVHEFDQAQLLGIVG